MSIAATERIQATDRRQIACVTNFAVKFGARLLMSGGEIWRADVVMRQIFSAYGISNEEIFILPHTIMISVEPEGEEPVAYHMAVGEILVNMEQVTALNRLAWDIRETPIPPEELMGRLQAVPVHGPYPRHMIVAGMTLAVVSLSYYFHVGILGSLLVALGIAAAMSIQLYLAEALRVNRFLLCGIASFVAGCILMLGAGLGLHSDPYILMVINCIGLIPGIPLINACREILLGKVLSGALLFMTAFVETLAVACGFSLASMLLGFLL